jgi:peptide/nickel transport system substrate-binding protein
MKPRSMGKRWLAAASVTVAISAVAAAAAGVFAAPAALGSARAASSTPLIMESSEETTLTDNFNPFVSTGAAATLGATSMIYETPLQFDLVRPLQKPYDFLAKSYKWGPGGKSITFTIRSNVSWSNGTPLTPADVAGTYNMLAKYPDTNTNGIPVKGATVNGQNVTVSFSSPAYTDLQYIGTTYIVPSSVYGLSSDPGKATITNPVGTGPYVLSSFSPTAGVTLTANPHYWGGPWNVGGGPPAVSEVEFPLLANATAVLSALESNQLDWAGNFLTGLSAFTKGPGHKVWFAGVNTNSLIPNLGSWPMNQLAVRKAVSLAIDRSDISKTGESGLEPVATNASGIVLPNFAADLAPAVKNAKLSPKADSAAADAVLKKAGYTLKGGWYALKGKVVDITISDPSDYADYAEDDKIMVQDLKAAHIKASFDGVSDTAWYASLANQSYGSATSHWSNSSIQMYGVYQGWLQSSLSAKGTKNAASGDFEGLDNPKIDAELRTLSAATTTKATLKAIAPIERYVAKNLPVIPTVYGASFDEYNSAAFTGWPSASNPYEEGQPQQPNNEVVVLHLKPTS